MKTKLKSIRYYPMFKNPFIQGMFSAFDLSGYSRMIHVDGSDADRRALKNDWEVIGGDFKDAVNEHVELSKK